MTARKRRWIRPIASVVLGVVLAATPLVSQPARAQGPNEPPPAEGEAKGEGRPLDGYLGTAALMLLALFIVGKSARR
jgi:hypothetical protein